MECEDNNGWSHLLLPREVRSHKKTPSISAIKSTNFLCLHGRAVPRSGAQPATVLYIHALLPAWPIYPCLPKTVSVLKMKSLTFCQTLQSQLGKVRWLTTLPLAFLGIYLIDNHTPLLIFGFSLCISPFPSFKSLLSLKILPGSIFPLATTSCFCSL